MTEVTLGTKSATILQFVRGLRGSLHETLEEGTWAAWLHDLLKPASAKSWSATRRTWLGNFEGIGTELTITRDLNRVMNRSKAIYRSWAIRCAGEQVCAPVTELNG